MEELMISMRMSQAMAAFPILEAEAPVLDQNETEERPKPVPSARRIRASAAATKPPAITADQETPDALASLPMELLLVGLG
jgi:hypothetical protein